MRQAEQALRRYDDFLSRSSQELAPAKVDPDAWVAALTKTRFGGINRTELRRKPPARIPKNTFPKTDKGPAPAGPLSHLQPF